MSYKELYKKYENEVGKYEKELKKRYPIYIKELIEKKIEEIEDIYSSALYRALMMEKDDEELAKLYAKTDNFDLIVHVKDLDYFYKKVSEYKDEFEQERIKKLYQELKDYERREKDKEK